MHESLAKLSDSDYDADIANYNCLNSVVLYCAMVLQRLLWWAKKLLHSIKIADIGTEAVICSLYKTSLKLPSVSLIA